VAKLLPKYPRLFYRIAGEGELRAELEALTKQLGLKEHVEFLGYVDHDDVKNLMMASHIFVLASVISEDGDEEGPSNVLNEAMASGMPVVGTDQTGFDEVVTDGVSGFLVPERDADALAERLDYLIQHTEQWAEMATAGRENVKEHYDIHKLNLRLTEIYRQLTEDRNSKETLVGSGEQGA
jgi:colanic acid/amylovoran biosynthesis glycosyltransferase